MTASRAPPVALVRRHARARSGTQLAGELLRELPGGVKALLRPGVQRVHVDPLDQLARGCRRGATRSAGRARAGRRGRRTSRIVSSESTGVSCQPSSRTAPARRTAPTGRSTLSDRLQLLAGERQPGVASRSASSAARRRRTGRGARAPSATDRPPRARQTEAVGERAALRPDIAKTAGSSRSTGSRRARGGGARRAGSRAR